MIGSSWIEPFLEHIEDKVCWWFRQREREREKASKPLSTLAWTTWKRSSMVDIETTMEEVDLQKGWESEFSFRIFNLLNGKE